VTINQKPVIAMQEGSYSCLPIWKRRTSRLMPDTQSTCGVLAPFHEPSAYLSALIVAQPADTSLMLRCDFLGLSKKKKAPTRRMPAIIFTMRYKVPVPTNLATLVSLII
jgi:hypothetical protein